MAGNLFDLANRIGARRSQIEQAANNAAIQVAMTIVTRLANITPVDTSRAISNWQVTIGQPSNFSLFPYYPGNFGSTEHASAQATIDAARQVLVGKRPGQTIFIVNNLDYIQRLNEGSSKQAPAGFVEQAVLLGRLVLRNFRVF